MPKSKPFGAPGGKPNAMTKNILSWGGGSKARIILHMLEECLNEQTNTIGIIDPNLEKLEFESDTPLLKKLSDIERALKLATEFIVCIGNEHGIARCRIAEKLTGYDLTPINLISKISMIDGTTRAGKGLQAMPGAIVSKFCKIGAYCILNTNCSIDHECNIGDGVHIMGSAAIAGKVKIGNYATVGTNATVLPGLTIGDGAYLGAGSVVTKNVEAHSIVQGVPARHVRYTEHKCDLSLFEQIKISK